MDEAKTDGCTQYLVCCMLHHHEARVACAALDAVRCRDEVTRVPVAVLRAACCMLHKCSACCVLHIYAAHLHAHGARRTLYATWRTMHAACRVLRVDMEGRMLRVGLKTCGFD